MNKQKVFRVFYQTDYSKGCIRVYIGNFFGKTNLKMNDKFLKFARLHCTNKQKDALLSDLEEEKQYQTKTQRDRIEKCIKRIKSQTWGTRK